MNPTKRLVHHVAEMLALEASIKFTLERLSELAAEHSEVTDLIQGFSQISTTHRKTLEARMAAIASETAARDAKSIELGLETREYPVSGALQQASAILNRAIIGYAMLRTVALRNRDSVLAGENNTGDIAEQHIKNYVAAVHKINQAINNVVVWEMGGDGEHCQCTCPSCGLGICLCAQAPRRTLSDAWAEVGPISTDTAVTIQEPRPDSAAAIAGLRAGDEVVSADGQQLETHFVLQGVISGHNSGESIDLRVRRQAGELEDVQIICR
jgi:hypothetical protein